MLKEKNCYKRIYDFPAEDLHVKDQIYICAFKLNSKLSLNSYGDLPAHYGDLPAHYGDLPAHYGDLPAHYDII